MPGKRRRLTDEDFVAAWVRAWRAGQSLTEFSLDAQQPYHALVNKHRALALLGIHLPPLTGQSGSQPKTAMRREKLKKLLDDLMAEPVL